MLAIESNISSVTVDVLDDSAAPETNEILRKDRPTIAGPRRPRYCKGDYPRTNGTLA